MPSEIILKEVPLIKGCDACRGEAILHVEVERNLIPVCLDCALIHYMGRYWIVDSKYRDKIVPVLVEHSFLELKPKYRRVVTGTTLVRGPWGVARQYQATIVLVDGVFQVFYAKAPDHLILTVIDELDESLKYWRMTIK